MGHHETMTIEIQAPAERVYAMVADLTRMGEWSPENDGAVWLNGATGAVPGARFKGTNSAGKKRWSTIGTIVEAEPGRVLSFRISAVGAKVALWSYRFETSETGCTVTESWDDERGAFITFAGKFTTGVDDRASHNRTGIDETLRNLKAAAET